MSVQVRLVRIDDEPESKARKTRTRAYTLKAGDPLDVWTHQGWQTFEIVGQEHSAVRVKTIQPGPGPKTVTAPMKE